MRLTFDRGTILLVDPPWTFDPASLPGAQWDERVQVHRAPAYRHAEIRAKLEGLGIQFRDEVPNAVRSPQAFRDFELRPYQEEAHADWAAAGRRGLVVLPTGSGKTRVAVAAIARAGVPAICLVPTRVLLEQWRKVLAELYPAEVGASEMVSTGSPR